jgi:hypothetical protein
LSRIKSPYPFPKNSEIIIPPQPFDLRPGIPVDNITLFILEIPGDDNEDISLADPDFLFDLPFDPAKARDTIKTFDTDMVCSHHELGTAEHLTVPFLGQFYPDNFVARGDSRFLVRQCNLSCSPEIRGILLLNCWPYRKYNYFLLEEREHGLPAPLKSRMTHGLAK